MATPNRDRVYVTEPLRSTADAYVGRLWADQDLRAYRLGRTRYERLQQVVDSAFWRRLRFEQFQRTNDVALELARDDWRTRLSAELRLLRRSDEPREPLPETDGGPRDVSPRDMPPSPTPERPPVTDGFDASPNPSLPGVVVIQNNPPLDEAAIQAWADFYAAFPPQV